MAQRSERLYSKDSGKTVPLSGIYSTRAVVEGAVSIQRMKLSGVSEPVIVSRNPSSVHFFVNGGTGKFHLSTVDGPFRTERSSTKVLSHVFLYLLMSLYG